MTVNLCAVSGTLVAPDGSPMPDVQVQFLPAPATVRGQGTQSLHPRPVAIAADAGAEIRVDLAPGVYTVRTRDSNGRDYQPYLIDVPNAAEAMLSDIMLLLPAPQTVYDAAASARVAANAAGAARESAQEAAGSAEEAALKGGSGDERTFSSRAAFLGATIPGTLERWTVLHSGKALDYVRDPDGTAIATDNGVKGSPAGVVTPEHFGAVGDGVADDTAAFVAMIAHMNARRISARLSTARYRVQAGQLVLTAPGLEILGEGKGNVANTTPTTLAPSEIILTGSGAGFRLQNQNQTLAGFRLTSDSARAAAAFDIASPGVRVEALDTQFARADRCRVNLRIDSQPGDGVLVVGEAVYFDPSGTDVYLCKGFGLRGDPGIHPDLNRTWRKYPGLYNIDGFRVGFCGGHAVALSHPSVVTQANMAIRCRINNLDTFGNCGNTDICYPSGDGTPYTVWIFGENCSITNSAPDGRTGQSMTPETAGGVYIAGRHNELINNRFINTKQPVRWGDVAAQPSTGLEVRGVRTTQTSLAPDLVARASLTSPGLVIVLDEFNQISRPVNFFGTGGLSNAHSVLWGQRRIGDLSVNASWNQVNIPSNGVARLRINNASAGVVFGFILSIASTAYANGCGRFHIRVGSGSPAVTKIDGHANTVAGSGAMDGTTGEAGRITVSTDDTSIYIENRQGGTRSITLGIDAANPSIFIESVEILP
jgi:hypothetical protein